MSSYFLLFLVNVIVQGISGRVGFIKKKEEIMDPTVFIVVEKTVVKASHKTTEPHCLPNVCGAPM